MYKYFSIFGFIGIAMLLFMGLNQSDIQKVSSETQECIDCHENVTPGIVKDWLKSQHSKIIPMAALQKNENEKKVSSKEIPSHLKNSVVGCYECHSLNPDAHKDNFEHFGFKINVVVSPNDCKSCHQTEVEEYSHSKKSYALDILRENPLYSLMVDTYTGDIRPDKGGTKIHNTFENSKNESCYACHGTEIEVKGLKTINSSMGELEVPDLSNWPNQGVGRINPDGSKGSCTSCHPRHNFSIETARQPYTCGQCHLEPDVPAYNVYKSSKHGNIFDSHKSDFKLKNASLIIGEDFTVPTCAVCHNSRIINSAGELVANRTHDFGARLWVRIFGLPYSHNQPKSPKTFEIKNQDNQPLPVTFSQIPAKEYLIDDVEVQNRKEKMSSICKNCHSTQWATKFFAKMDSTNAHTDRLVRTATDMLMDAYKKKLIDPKNPFDEPIETYWVNQWLMYANSIRYATAMSGPDYAGFKNGWYHLTNNVRMMQKEIERSSKK